MSRGALRRRRPVLVGLGAVVLVGLLTALLAQLWYRTVREGEQEAGERGLEQVAALLLRRIDREGAGAVDAIVADFDVAVDAHVAVAVGSDVRLSAGTPPGLAGAVLAVDETDVLRVRRRELSVGGVRYEVYGGVTPDGIRAYAIRRATAPDRASTLRPAFVAGWAATVVLTAVAAFAVGRRRAVHQQRARDRERSLTSAIAHDLRTPLASVVTSAGLLAAHLDELPPTVRRPAEVLLAELERLRTLVEDLLELARLEAGDHELHVEDVAVADVVRDVLAARSWAGAVDTDLDDAATVAADRLSLSRTVLNLVENAVRHGGGEVCVRVRQDRAEVVVQVSDGGHGVAAGDLQRLLAGEPSGGAGRRGGLGLRIAQQNAALHGARITAAVDEAAGTTLTLRLPAAAPLDRIGRPPW